MIEIPRLGLRGLSKLHTGESHLARQVSMETRLVDVLGWLRALADTRNHPTSAPAPTR